jgi:signal transduction histidine kinase
VAFRFQFGGSGPDRGPWLVLGLLLLAVLVPTGCLVYFMNEAIGKQRDLASRKLDDAYRGQLRLVAERIDSFWEQRAHDLDGPTESASPALFFEYCVLDRLADSVIVLDRSGAPAYPSLPAVPGPDPTLQQPPWAEARLLENAGKLEQAAQKYAVLAKAETDPSSAARAAQAEIRCLAATGKKGEAINAIESQFQQLRLAYATGLDGRLIEADELLFELRLLGAGRYDLSVARHLRNLLRNYASPIPSAQRLFLMGWMRALSIGEEYKTFPTYDAERLAGRVLAEGRAVRGDLALRLTGIADVWTLTSPSGRTLALYNGDTVMRNMSGLVEPHSLAVTPPGRPLPPNSQWIDAGPRMPGWRISTDAATLGGTAQRQITAYLWIGFLAVATMAVLAVIAGQILRRQMRISHLKTDLVAAVSHELKTPLSSMKLLVESLLGGQEFEPQRTREYLRLVARENSRLSRLIDNFLTFSRMERNKGRFDFARVQPEDVAHAAMESVGDRFPVGLEIGPDLPPLYADEDALVTVLLNLLDNAYKYTGDNRRIGLRVLFQRGWVTFAVTDNGIGIAERDQKRIFRRFYQVDRRLARQAGGVGLGLSIVEFIVKAHGGLISVVSRPGTGSTFTVSLPPSSAATGAAA